jgi:hypothetical protein
MALLNALFEANTLKELLQICNDVYTKEAVEDLSDFFTGTTPALREVCDAAVEYCNANESLLDDNVYLLTAPNGKQYVGQTTNVKNRIKDYKKNKGSNSHWTSALRLYTIDKFKIEHYAIPTACADIIEKFMILWHDLINSDNGYNKTSGGKNGWLMSSEIRAKIRASHLGIPFSDERKAAMKAWWTPVRRNDKSITMSGENHPLKGKTGEKSHLFGKKRPNHGDKMSGKNNPMFGMTGENNPMFGKKNPGVSKRNRERKGEKHQNFGKFGENSIRATPVVVNGTLFGSSIDASEKVFSMYARTYVSKFITTHKKSVAIFKVSKDFYIYCHQKKITENITRDMFETFASTTTDFLVS